MSDNTCTSILYPKDQTPLPKPAPKGLEERSILDLFSLKNKICVVTGAARFSGIGFNAAKAYCEAGCKGLALWDYADCTEAAKYLSETYGTTVKVYKVDVTSSKNVQDTINQVVADFGAIDVFVANAGVAWETGPVVDEQNDDDRSWHKLIDVDVNGVYYCARHVGKIFQKQKSGSLIITASMSGLIVNIPNMQMPYNAAKAACIHMAKSLAVEFANFGARVNAICPGYMDTGLSDFLDQKVLNTWVQLIPMGRQGIAKELAGAYLYLATDASNYTTGSAMVIDGGYTAP